MMQDSIVVNPTVQKQQQQKQFEQVCDCISNNTINIYIKHTQANELTLYIQLNIT